MNESTPSIVNAIYAGYLEHKGPGMIIQWKKRWVVLSSERLKIFGDKDVSTFICELKFDERTRIAIAEHSRTGILMQAFTSQEPHKFCVLTSAGQEEFNTYSSADRSKWVRHLSEVAEAKSVGSGFVMKVEEDADFQNLRQWEDSLLTHNIDLSTGLVSLDKVDFPPGVPRNPAQLATDDLNFTGFLPFEEWLRKFDPVAFNANETSKKMYGKKRPKETSEQIRDYMVDKIVERYSNHATPKVCNLLLEGFCEVIARSERQLVCKFHHCDTTAECKTQAGKANAARKEKCGKCGTATLDLTLDIPQSIRVDLIAMLGALRAMVSSYRFEEYGKENEMRFLRKLAVHRLLVCTKKILVALQRECEGTINMVTEKVEQAKRAVGNAMEDATHEVKETAKEAGAMAENVEQQTSELLEIQRSGAVKALAAGFMGKEDGSAESAQCKGKKDHDKCNDKDLHKGQHNGQEKEHDKGEHNGQDMVHDKDYHKDHGMDKEKCQDKSQCKDKDHNKGKEQCQDEGQGKCKDKEGAVEKKGEPLPTEQRRNLIHKGAELREQALERLRDIIRPLVTRMKDEVAPLVQSFAERNEINLEELEGIAKDVTNSVGASVTGFVERNVDTLEKTITQQLEVVQEVASGLQDVLQDEDLTVDRAVDTAARTYSEVVGTQPEELADKAHQFTGKVKELRGEVLRTLEELKAKAGEAWNGTAVDVLETVVLQRADMLHAGMKEAARRGTSYAMITMLLLFAAGMRDDKAPVTSLPGGGDVSTMYEAAAEHKLSSLP